MMILWIKDYVGFSDISGTQQVKTRSGVFLGQSPAVTGNLDVRVRSDAWTAWVGRGFCDWERDFSSTVYVIQEQSQLKPSTVVMMLFLHSNLKHHTKDQVVWFPSVPSNVSNFPSVAGRVSI